MSPGQRIAGASVSLTVTVNVQALVFPLASVAVQVTSVLPLANVAPLVGLHVTVSLGQGAVAAGAVKLATVVHWLEAVFVLMSAGHAAMTGFSVSLIVTVNVQALVFPLASVAVQVTVVVPLLKLEPVAGMQ